MAAAVGIVEDGRRSNEVEKRCRSLLLRQWTQIQGLPRHVRKQGFRHSGVSNQIWTGRLLAQPALQQIKTAFPRARRGRWRLRPRKRQRASLHSAAHSTRSPSVWVRTDAGNIGSPRSLVRLILCLKKKAPRSDRSDQCSGTPLIAPQMPSVTISRSLWQRAGDHRLAR